MLDQKILKQDLLNALNTGADGKRDTLADSLAQCH